MFRKLSAMAIVAIMLLVSLSFMSFNAYSEDVSGPFAERSDGYPLYILDQEQAEGTTNHYQIASNQWRGQTFRPSANGKLGMISVNISDLSSTGGELIAKICDSDQVDLPIGGNVLAEESIPWTSIPSTYQWFNITFSNPPSLTAGVQYAIVLTGTTGFLGQWIYASNYYSDGGLGWSFDNGNTWDGATLDMKFRTYMSSPDAGLKKIAWHPDGKYALAVNGFDDSVYRYERETTTWSLEANPDASLVFHDIIWDDYYNEFYLVGEDTTGRGAAYSYNGMAFGDLFSTTSMGAFYSVATCGGYGDYNFLAVGEKTGGYGFAAWHHNTLGWVEISSGFQSGFPEQLKGVTWNYRTNASTAHYAVGIDDEGLGFVYKFVTGSTTASYVVPSGLEPCNTISWNPQYSLGADYDYALIGTSQYHGIGNCYKYNGVSAPVLISKDIMPIYDISWHPDGDLAVLVGGQGGSGIVYHHSQGARNIIDMTSEVPGSPDTFYGVAVKGPSSPSSAIIIGSSGSIADYVDASNVDTMISVNAAYPHLYWIGFNDTSHVSRIEQQVAPDEWYEFSFAANYSLGWTNCEVIVEAWYDEGAVGDASAYPASADDNRCLAFRLNYDPSIPFYTMSSPGGPEYVVGGANDVIVGGGAPGEEIHYVTLGVRLGPQVRNANGNSFSSGDTDTDALKNNALLDANSWDFNVTVRDSTSTNAAVSMYSEFGIDKAVSISVTGNPAGNAPPGSSDVTLSNPSQITYSSNANYWVNASVPNLYLDGDTGSTEWIDANNVAAANSNVFADPLYTEMDGADYPVGRAFTGPGADLCVWGNRSQAQTYIDAPSNGSVSFGPFGSDYNAAWTNGGITYTEVNWWVTVPGSTQEGIYWAYITITIEAEGS